MERTSVRRLREEIRQSKPFQSASHAAALALIRTVDEVRRRASEMVDLSGISMEQYNVLRILRGSRGTPMPVLDIAARLLERNPGITRLLDKLETKGLVTRVRCTHDRRQVLCSITETGLALLKSLDKPAEQANQSLFAALSESEIYKLIDLLDRIRHPERPKESGT
ncbi:MAG: MarR family transcriptional regulator [Acidobacteria bacterium]|nr:MarR family transcriptional regulator [Acidobacteriota bacterium]